MGRWKECHSAEDASTALRTPPQVHAGERGEEIAALGRLGQQHRGGGGQQSSAKIELGGATIRVPSGSDMATLRAVLQAIKAVA